MSKRVYCLEVVYGDQVANEFIHLGGAGWHTRREQLRQWNSILEEPDGDILLDKYAACGDLEDTRFIAAVTAERLLGKPFAHLLAEGRKQLEVKKSLDRARSERLGPQRETEACA